MVAALQLVQAGLTEDVKTGENTRRNQARTANRVRLVLTINRRDIFLSNS